MTKQTFIYKTPEQPVRASTLPAVVREQTARNVDVAGFDPVIGLAQHFDDNNSVGTPRQSLPEASESPESVSKSDSGMYFAS